VGVTGTYSIQVDTSSNYALSCVTLVDRVNGIRTNLQPGTSYSFFISDTTVFPRFLLKLTALANVSATDALCAQSPTGTASITSPVPGPTTFTWRNNSGQVVRSVVKNGNTDQISGLTAGMYSVEFSSSQCNCIPEPLQVTVSEQAFSVDFTVTEDTIPLDFNPVSFAAATNGCTWHSWNFGDGTNTDLNAATSHTFSAPGTYYVTLISGNSGCADTVIKNITVQAQVTSVKDEITVTRVEGGLSVLLPDNSNEKYSIRLYDITGKSVLEPVITFSGQKVFISTGEISKGVYLISLVSRQGIVTKQVFF
jgi:PKD repeat protein